MTAKKPPKCSCWICKLNPWLLKGLLLVPFLGIALGGVGIFTDVGGKAEPKPPVAASTPTVNGVWVTFTPTATATAPAVSLPAPIREIVITAPQPPPTVAPPVVVVVVEAPVEEPTVRPTRTPVPTNTAAPTSTPVSTATPCWPLPSQRCGGKR